jgi:CRISPR-associated protein, Cas2 family
MIIMILENVPTGLRGELSRWLIEPKTGVFVGDLSARVRDKLWEKCVNKVREGGVIQIWSTKNEQKFQIRMAGETTRQVVEVEGLQLIEAKSDDQKMRTCKKRLRPLSDNTEERI